MADPLRTVEGFALLVALFGFLVAVYFEVRAGYRHNELIGTLVKVGDDVVKDIADSERLTQQNIERAAELAQQSIERAAERTFEAIAKDGAETRKTIAEVHKSIKEEIGKG